MSPAAPALLLLVAPQVDPSTGSRQPADPPAAALSGQVAEPGVAAPDGEIVVIGRRWGDATTPSESEIGEDEIAARAADSIGTLLDQLRPLIDETGEEPVLLVNGRPLGLDRSLLSFPTEALERVAVLQREAAARYGQPGDRRVVNLVLKQRFASIDSEAGVFGPTAGGQTGGLLTARRVGINGGTRWNANARFERQGALLRSARDLPPRAQAPEGVDPNDYETLLSSRRTLAGSISATRPIGAFSGTLTIDASDIGSAGLRGLAPDAETPLRALRSSNASRSLGTTVTLSGVPGGWQTNFTAGMARSWSRSLIESTLGTTGNRARNGSVIARVNVNKSLLSLPAGPLTTSYTLNFLENQSQNQQSDGTSDRNDLDRRTRRQLDGNVSFGIPLSRNGGKESGPLGRLSMQLSIGAQAQTGGGTQTAFGGGLIWAPVPMLELRGNVERAGTSPTVDQLDGPLVTNVIRVFDYARQETVEVARLTGGNATLLRGQRRRMSLSAKLLFADQRLTLSSTYRQQSSINGVLAFPELTPAIDAAFRDRVTRGPDGRLLAIDARPIAITSDENAELFSSTSLRLNRRRGDTAVNRPPSPLVASWTVNASLSHRWRLRDRLVVRDGVPPIDRLNGDGGQPRHTLSMQATAARPGFGINAATTWNTTTNVRGTDAANGAVRVRSPIVLNLDLFVRPDETGASRGSGVWYENTTITLLVQNVLNDYRRVIREDGSAPPGYSRAEIDPAGRTFRIVVRKRF